MVKGRSLWMLLGGLLIGAAIVYVAFQYSPFFKPLPPQNPEPAKPEYEYYVIIDEATGKTLAHVSSITVSVGDEYVTGENQRYVVTRIVENRAYARNFGPVKVKDKGGQPELKRE